MIFQADQFFYQKYEKPPIPSDRELKKEPKSCKKYVVKISFSRYIGFLNFRESEDKNLSFWECWQENTHNIKVILIS